MAPRIRTGTATITIDIGILPGIGGVTGMTYFIPILIERLVVFCGANGRSWPFATAQQVANTVDVGGLADMARPSQFGRS
jgi:hypothetical protein